jgi:hypothetical protein
LSQPKGKFDRRRGELPVWASFWDMKYGPADRYSFKIDGRSVRYALFDRRSGPQGHHVIFFTENGDTSAEFLSESEFGILKSDLRYGSSGLLETKIGRQTNILTAPPKVFEFVYTFVEAVDHDGGDTSDFPKVGSPLRRASAKGSRLKAVKPSHAQHLQFLVEQHIHAFATKGDETGFAVLVPHKQSLDELGVRIPPGLEVAGMQLTRERLRQARDTLDVDVNLDIGWPYVAPFAVRIESDEMGARKVGIFRIKSGKRSDDVTLAAAPLFEGDALFRRFRRGMPQEPIGGPRDEIAVVVSAHVREFARRIAGSQWNKDWQPRESPDDDLPF